MKYLQNLKNRGGVALATLTVCIGVLYSGTALAWQNCRPVAIYEVAARSFQVNCSNGSSSSVPTWVVFRAGNSSTAEMEAMAARFQAMVLAAILSGQQFRIEPADDATLCAGIADCKKATMWGLIP